MKLHRIYGVLMHFFYLFRSNIEQSLEVFYWPIIDLVIWGLASAYFQSYSSNAPDFILMIASGVLFWMIVYRGQMEISFNTLTEVWNKNLINLFVSPLTLSEWIVAMLMLSITKSIVTFAFGAGVALVLYKIHIFAYGFLLLPIIGLMLMTGWSVGFLLTGVILRYGTRVQAISWTLTAALSPFAAVFYPISMLPHWAQLVSRAIPLSYVFEASRSILFTGVMEWKLLLISFILNCVYLAVSFAFLKRSFMYVRVKKGLVKVY